MYASKDGGYLIIAPKTVPGHTVLCLGVVVYLAVHAEEKRVVDIEVETTKKAA
jgi:hypothetical protein